MVLLQMGLCLNHLGQPASIISDARSVPVALISGHPGSGTVIQTSCFISNRALLCVCPVAFAPGIDPSGLTGTRRAPTVGPAVLAEPFPATTHLAKHISNAMLPALP